MSVIVPCETPGCGGEVAVGLFTEIRVQAIGPDGQTLTKDGQPVKVTIRLPKHVLPLPLRSGTPLVTAEERERRAAEFRRLAEDAGVEL